ncbi:MAG: ABC transporter ATP-binding protein [Candidatus Eremiobacteraeota bacterium]|nr:ABC transporter ATP-binding protein [Candidatus Eremiobacteraeota bacterium]MBC5827589.1 ABC transporter ATP-binding protein [Candidatus Eremiobacteraeota bacterium]
MRFARVAKRYGSLAVVDDVSFDVPRGTCVVILGPSGCGKTTLLKTVNRLSEPTSGDVFVDGRNTATAEATALRRKIGYVIQHVGLFPHMTVAENVSVVPSLLGWPKEKRAARTDELLDLVHLDAPRYRGRYPRQLSGGQQQRVGLARALAADPTILLMDEPFGAVDAIERAHLQREMIDLQTRLHKTIIFVTHDVDEALRLADRIVIMRAGKVEQYDTPVNVLASPASDFVAQLVDSDNVLRRLSIIKVEAAMAPPSASPSGRPHTAISADASLQQALSLMIGTACDSLSVVGGTADVVGRLSMAQIRAAVTPAPTAS